jgi:hypothetical protein
MKKSAASASREIPAKRVDATHAFAQTVLDLVSKVPPSVQPTLDDPERRAKEIVRAAKSKAALASASMALPPGPLGWVTVLPEIYAVWKIQAQMVSDLANLYGQEATLNREHMLYCLFRHTGAQLFRDLVMRVGERYLVRRVPLRSLYSIANKIGLRITQRSLGRAVSRVVPLAGAIGVGAYSWYDTRQVARTAIDLFSRGLTTEAPTADKGSAETPKTVRPAIRRGAKIAPRKAAAKTRISKADGAAKPAARKPRAPRKKAQKPAASD